MSKKAITIVAVILAATAVTLAALFILEATDTINLFGNDEQISEHDDKSDKNDSKINHAKSRMNTQGGSELVYFVNAENPDDKQMETIVNMLRIRLDALGYTEATVSIPNKNLIKVEIPSLTDPQKVASNLGATAQLQFMDARDNVVLTSTDIKSASVQHGQITEFGTAGNYVEIKLTAEGREKFKKATENAIALKSTGENYISIVMDDTDISMPYVEQIIDSEVCVISGDFTKESAKALAANIRSGQLPFTLELVDTHLVAPSEK